MNRKVLIISPYFPPSNAADMQRTRMSIPYFKEFGWNAEIVTVDQVYSDFQKDSLFIKSIPADLKIHAVKAFNKKWTSKLGLGSIALRSLWFYRQKVNQLLKQEKFDLIYFSTTQFPVCILGAYWKKRFKIPYVIDMQDPWHTAYYLDKPVNERPPKYWFAYRLNKWLEPLAVKNVNGLISVSEKYLTDLSDRYPVIKPVPMVTIPLAVSPIDFQIGRQEIMPIQLNSAKIAVVYAGVVGSVMQSSLKVLFTALKKLKTSDYQLYKKINISFIGTSYAPASQAKKTVIPLAEQFGVSDSVHEDTNRIGFYATIKLITHADGLLIIGTDDPGYTASKLYPYILAKKPLLAILHSDSSATSILRECKAGLVLTLDTSPEGAYDMLCGYFSAIEEEKYEILTDWDLFQKYTAKEMTRNQCLLFDKVVNE